MIERTTILSFRQEPNHLGELAVKKEQLLFFDIETTGLKADSSSLYLIGCCFFEEGAWRVVQWFADDYESEEKMISLFIKCMNKHPLIVQYNGEVFDLKYLRQKAKAYGIEFPSVIKQSEAYESRNPDTKDGKNSEMPDSIFYNDCCLSIDLYRHIKLLKGICRLKSMKLADISNFFGFERKDEFSGGELLYTYSDYMKLRILSRCHSCRGTSHVQSGDGAGLKEVSLLPDFDAGRIYSDYDYHEFHRQLQGKKEEELLEELMLHNYEDIVSMIPVFGVTRTTELLHYPCLLWDVEKLSNHLFWEENKSEKILHAEELVFPLKNRILHIKESDRAAEKLILTSGGFTLYCHTIETELKLFYPDYRNYYYLPIEDYAVHKSIGAYLEKERCQKAKPDNAYTRHEDEYIELINKKDAVKFILKQHRLMLPVLFKDYRSNCGYVRFSDILNPAGLMEYLKIIIMNFPAG